MVAPAGTAVLSSASLKKWSAAPEVADGRSEGRYKSFGPVPFCEE